MTCAGSVSSISEAGKRLHITVIGYIDDKEVNRLEKEYITDGNTLIETFSVSIQGDMIRVEYRTCIEKSITPEHVSYRTFFPN